MSGRLENSKARNIRLVGLDLDGTVFTDEKTITPATKDAIARAVRAGVAVLPVTGRPRSGLPEEVLAIPGVRYAITSNGAMCEDLAEGSVLVRLAMDEETALRALHIAEKYDVVIDIYIDGQAYTAAESMQLVQTHVPESFRPYFLKTRRLVENREQLLRRKGRGAEKFTILFRDMAQRAAAWQDVSDNGGGGGPAGGHGRGGSRQLRLAAGHGEARLWRECGARRAERVQPGRGDDGYRSPAL